MPPNDYRRRPSIIVGIVRAFLAIVFIAYGVVKIFGGQFFYGDWTMSKTTVDGPSLVWAFYGYSPFYGRFIGFCELIPAILLLFPRAALVGAMALFPVALNITVMDFTYNFPEVRYMALFYTLLLAFLLFTDRARLLALVAPIPPRSSGYSSASRPRRGIGAYALWVIASVFVLFVANLVATSVSEGPERAAMDALVLNGWPREHMQLVRSRLHGLYGVTRTATIDIAVTDPATSVTDTLHVEARKALGITPWRFDNVPHRASR